MKTEQTGEERKTAETLNSCEPGWSTNRPPSQNARSDQITFGGEKKKKENKMTENAWQ